jgi:hypothetical protein
MGFLKRLSPEAQAERQRVRKAIAAKTLTAACGSAVFFFFLFVFNPIQLPPWLAPHVPFWVIPAIVAFSMFLTVLFFSWIIFRYLENIESTKRLAAITQSKQRAEQETLRQQLEARAQQEQQRVQAMRLQAQQESYHLENQKNRDDREFMLKRLTNINNFIDLYDPATPDRAARVRQGIAKVLNEIIIKHNSAELQAMIAREPEVRGLFTTVTDRLKAKQIESAEANQILSAIG